MKRMLFSQLFLFASLFTAQAQTTADEAAIKVVVEAESCAWLAADPTAFNDCWQVQPYTRILVSLEDGTCYDIGPDQMKAATADAMGMGGSFQNSNYRSRISTDLAWLTYDEVKTDPKGKKSYSHEVRILEKFEGRWKIVGMTVHHYKL